MMCDVSDTALRQTDVRVMIEDTFIGCIFVRACGHARTCSFAQTSKRFCQHTLPGRVCCNMPAPFCTCAPGRKKERARDRGRKRERKGERWEESEIGEIYIGERAREGEKERETSWRGGTDRQKVGEHKTCWLCTCIKNMEYDSPVVRYAYTTDIMHAISYTPHPCIQICTTHHTRHTHTYKYARRIYAHAPSLISISSFISISSIPEAYAYISFSLFLSLSFFLSHTQFPCTRGLHRHTRCRVRHRRRRTK